MAVKIEVPQWPADARALLGDPRLADLQFVPGLPEPRFVLKPANLAKRGESPFALFHYSMESASGAKVTWENEPNVALAWGHGNGFPEMTEQPRFTDARSKPRRMPDAWVYGHWLIASPRFVAPIVRLDAQAVETVPLEWRFNDGAMLDGYVFLDVRRLVDAYDYARTEVVVIATQRGKSLFGLGQYRAVKPGLDTNLHIFRDVADRSSIFVSRPLAEGLLKAKLKDVDFVDPADGWSIRYGNG